MATTFLAYKRPLWQWFLICIILMGLVVGMNALYMTIARSENVLSAEAGSVVYVAAFDGFEDEWQQYAGRLSSTIADGALTLAVDDTNTTIYSLAAPTLADFDLSVTAMPVGGPVDNGYGVAFRVRTPADTCDMPLVVLCDLAQIDALSVPLRLLFRPVSARADGYYMFLISADGYYSLWKADRSSGATIARKASTWIASPLIQQGLNATNMLRIVARGDQFTFYINGQAVELCIPDDPTLESTYSGGQCLSGTMQARYTDSSFVTGQVGMVAQTTPNGGAGVTVSFDTLIIKNPAPPASDQT